MNHKLIGMALTGALVLAACGQAPQTPVGNSQAGNGSGNTGGGNTGGGNTTPTPANDCATLTIDMTGGPALASVSLMQGDKLMRQMQVDASTKTFKVPAGSYTVSGNVNGYTLNSPASVTLACDASATATLDFRSAVAAQVAAVSTDLDGNKNALDDKAFTDPLNYAMDYQYEANGNKIAELLAAQTEEAVNVTMVARDSAGNPVPGAIVRVSADSDSVSIAPGHVLKAGAQATPTVITAQGMSSPDIVADGSGIVRFHVYGLSSVQTGAPPVRFVVNANSGAGSTTSANAEFKVFFFNISHLFLSANGTIYPSSDYKNERGDPVGQRVGGVVSNTFAYNFYNAGLNGPDTNSFTTGVYQKQPQGDFTPINGGEQNLAPGTVEYSVVGGNGQDKLSLVTNSDGSVSVVPGAGDTSADFQSGPLALRVRASYYATVTFGATTYRFLLKEFEFNVNFSTAILQIQKTGPDIQTWTGYLRDLNGDGDGLDGVIGDAREHDPYLPDDITIPQTLDPSGVTPRRYDDIAVGKTYPYTIKVTNSGATTANNVVIRDVLPAELGYVLGSAQVLDNSGAVIPDSGVEATYSLQQHAVNISFTANSSLRNLAGGQSLSVQLQVYPRQKPGYAWTANSDTTGGTNDTVGQNTHQNGRYADPYQISNRAKVVSDNSREVNDYKTIYVVRPIATLDKSGPASVYNNQRARFDITLRNIDRAAEDVDGGVRAAYADLKSRFADQYPNEGFLYWPRIVDQYGSQLDFINAFDASGTRAVEGSASGNNTFALDVPVTDHRMLNGTSYSLGADFQVEDSVANGGNANNYRNCAYAYAWNLNQPNDGVPSNGIQYEGLLGNQTVAPNVTITRQGHGVDNGRIEVAGRNLLADCATLNVVPSPSFNIGLQDYDVFGNPLGDDNTIPQGSNFSYILQYVNESRGDAHNVRITTTSPGMEQLQSVNVVYNGQPLTISLENDSGSLTVDGDTTISYTRAGNAVNFLINTFNSRDSFTATYNEYASQAGEGKFRSTLDWNENVTGAPIVEEEYTKVAQR